MAVYVGADELYRFALNALTRAGVSGEHASIVADHLVRANLRGVDSHGIIRLPYYVDGILRGEINPRPMIKVVAEGSSYALIDGDHGLGQVVALKATEIAIDKARSSGIAFVGARNLSHVGMLAYYVERIASNGLVGIASANAAPNIAPLGCKQPITGTNPLAIGFPTRSRPPVILDMAMSAAARGKILVAARKGEKIPEGWAMNREGRITTDPREALEGILLPFGGYKGFGLALAIDILCGIVLGAGYSLKLKRGWFSQGGFSIMAIKIDIFRPYNEYLEEIEEYIERVKSTPTVEGFEALIPGEPEYRAYRERIERGIPLDEETFKDLQDLANKLGIEPPSTLKLRH
ncbi:MAG: Ldh family oxidoreductase [Sulfolobales archaeon]